MAQDRMLRASMRTSEKVNGWPIPLRYFWSQLWGYCDDFGRGRYDARLIVADTFPIDDDVTAQVVSRWMQALELAGVIRLYEVGGKRYFECIHWPEHQEISYLKKTDIPNSSGAIPSAGKRSEKVQSVPKLSNPREGEEKGKLKEVEGESTTTPFCPRHPDGTDKPCRACKLARETFEGNAKPSGPAKPPSAREAKELLCGHGRPIGQCKLCEDDARILAPALDLVLREQAAS